MKMYIAGAFFRILLRRYLDKEKAGQYNLSKFGAEKRRAAFLQRGGPVQNRLKGRRKNAAMPALHFPLWSAPLRRVKAYAFVTGRKAAISKIAIWVVPRGFPSHADGDPYFF